VYAYQAYLSRSLECTLAKLGAGSLGTALHQFPAARGSSRAPANWWRIAAMITNSAVRTRRVWYRPDSG
jgi:hypothetical protein